jgi:ribosomal protein S18 acetylase RimI-like enzyme
MIRRARKDEAKQIAELFMLAWPLEEILESNGLTYEQLHESMTAIAAAEETIYSYENTIVAEVKGKVVGAMCAYDGADYQRLKQPIVEVLGADSGFAQVKETEAGEFYLDSVGVLPGYRGRGIASSLFEAQCERAALLGHKVAGLIVDVDKPQAEALYARLGFTYLDDKDFFGHTMKHMVRSLGMFEEEIERKEINKQ